MFSMTFKASYQSQTQTVVKTNYVEEARKSNKKKSLLIQDCGYTSRNSHLAS